jgi:ABC-2 type transport system ATP-binding protein
VTLALERAGFLALAGPNGAGKSSLLRIIAGLIDLDAGTGSILGYPLPLHGSAARRRISAVLDEPAFWPWMSGSSVLRTVSDLAGAPSPDAPALLAEVGLEPERSHRIRRKAVRAYSQGMRKRLQVACALAVEAELLILDEPTSTLDDDGAQLVWRAIAERRRRGATVVVATHDPAGAAAFGARIVTLAGGAITGTSGAALVPRMA